VQLRIISPQKNVFTEYAVAEKIMRQSRDSTKKVVPDKVFFHPDYGAKS
jgi:hypothetical protein